jgi:uncharacterized tellurite resistance protein B-like protein
MQLTTEQLAAVLKAATAMVMADGKATDSEKVVMAQEMGRFGVPSEDVIPLLKRGEAMDAAKMLTILSNLSAEAKKYVSCFLAAIMASDGEIADSELNVWRFVCTLAEFPSMNVHEALVFWKDH